MQHAPCSPSQAGDAAKRAHQLHNDPRAGTSRQINGSSSPEASSTRGQQVPRRTWTHSRSIRRSGHRHQPQQPPNHHQSGEFAKTFPEPKTKSSLSISCHRFPPRFFFFLIRSWVNLERTKLLYKTATLHLPGVEEAKLFAEFNPNSRSSLNYPHTVILECGELSACQNVSHLPGAALHHFGRLQLACATEAAEGRNVLRRAGEQPAQVFPQPLPKCQTSCHSERGAGSTTLKKVWKIITNTLGKKKKNPPPQSGK